MRKNLARDGRIIFSASVLSTRNDRIKGSIESGARVVNLRAISEAEAEGMALKYARTEFPLADGWEYHRASVLKIPDEWIKVMGRKESERWRRRLAAVFRDSAALWERWRDCSQVALVSRLYFEAVRTGATAPPTACRLFGCRAACWLRS